MLNLHTQTVYSGYLFLSTLIFALHPVRLPHLIPTLAKLSTPGWLHLSWVVPQALILVRARQLGYKSCMLPSQFLSQPLLSFPRRGRVCVV